MLIDLEKYTKLHSPGYVIEIYHDGNDEEIIFGNRGTSAQAGKCDQSTLYDIASLTKVYTATLVYIAYEEGRLDLQSYIKDIDERFLYLDNVTVTDLLSHNQNIWTDGYLGDAKTEGEFYEILFSAKVKSNLPTYVDAHYIILATLLEKIYSKPLDEILEEKIFRRLELKHTTVNPTGDNIASNNCDKLGMVHDTKARVAKGFGITTGHASIFTTGSDLLKFLKSFLDNSLLTPGTINLMLMHGDGNYNNMGVRYRNGIGTMNDIPTNCSKHTVTFSGYTGPAFIIDFEKKVIVAIMCNVLCDTKLNRSERKHTTDMMISEVRGQILR